MTTIRRIVTSQVDGNDANANNDNEIRPFGETAIYLDQSGPVDKPVLSIHDGVRTHIRSKVLGLGVLYGSNADSGDNNNYDTIKLVPDALRFDQGSDQYIIVDPTAPDHIHLRAGGTIDNSSAALILGGENSNVEIQAGENPPVYIRANSNTWTFETNGDLSFPNGLTVYGGIPTLAVDTGNNLGISTSRIQFVSANCYIAVGEEFVADIEFNDDITVVQVGWTVEVGGTTYTVTAIDPAPPANQYRITAAGASFVQGITYTFDNPVPVVSTWVFDNNGALTTPGSGTITHINNDLTVAVSGTDVIVLRTDGGDTVITSDGDLQLGGNIVTQGIVELTNIGSVTAYTPGIDMFVALQGFTNSGVALRATDAELNSKDWLFGTDGTLTFPGGMTIETEYGGGARLVIDGKGNFVDIRDSGTILIGYNSTGSVQIGNPEGGTLTEIISEKVKFLLQTVPTHSTGAPGDEPGLVAFDNNYMYYCTGLYGQTGHQIVVAADYLGRTSLNTNGFQLTKTADTLQITVGDIISDDDGGATSTVVAVTSDENYVYVSTGGVAYAAQFPLTFTSTDYVAGGNIWKRVSWSNDTW